MPEDIEIFKDKLRKLCDLERLIGESLGAGDELGSGSPLEKLDDKFDELVYMYKKNVKENS